MDKTEIRKNIITYIAIAVILLLINLLINFTVYRGEKFDVHLPGSDDFGTSSFVITMVFGILYSILIYFSSKKKWKIEYIYLLLAIPIGTLYLIYNPLGKVPDEDMHARKSMAISYGNFFSTQVEDGKAVYPINSKINELVTRSTTSYDEALKRIEAEETDERIPLEYTTMALYAPICHMPQAFGMFVTRIFGASIVVQCYAARTVNMLLAIFLVFEAIKLIPFKKYIVLMIGLLPITMNEFASMASDAFAIGFSLFYIALIFNIKYKETPIERKDKIFLVIYSLIVALLKIVYMPLVFLLLLIPRKKYNNKKEKNVFSAIVIAISIIINLIWLVYCTRFLVEFNQGVDGKAQVINILQNPIGYILVMFRTMNTFAQTFITSLCGEGLGHYNVQTSVLYVFSCIMMMTVLFLAKEEDDDNSFDFIVKAISFIVFGVIVLLIYTSVYVQWTPATKPIIYGIQARYFIPILPLVIVFLDNCSFIIKKINKSYLFLFVVFMNLNAVCMIMYTYVFGNVLDFYIK